MYEKKNDGIERRNRKTSRKNKKEENNDLLEIIYLFYNSKYN